MKFNKLVNTELAEQYLVSATKEFMNKGEKI